MSYTIRLRALAFETAARRAGFSSDYALARAMKVDRSTVMRVRKGDLHPGPAFIGGALKALSPMRFDDLFMITQLGAPPSDS